MYYGWINETILFNMDVICDNTPLQIGTNVLALVGENKRTQIPKAIKVWLRFCRASFCIACCCVAVITRFDQSNLRKSVLLALMVLEK